MKLGGEKTKPKSFCFSSEEESEEENDDEESISGKIDVE